MICHLKLLLLTLGTHDKNVKYISLTIELELNYLEEKNKCTIVIVL